MNFEDASGRAERAVQRLLEGKQALDLSGMEIQLLGPFISSAQPNTLTRGEKEDICDQAILLIDQLYPHLRFKRVRYAIDPVQRLRLLRARSARLTDLQFHCETLRAFAEMRDVHTFYRLPAPFRQAIAFLPFFLKSYGVEGRRRFLVTNVLEGFEEPETEFRRGAEVTHWNGVPIARAVDILAEHIPGGNPAAKFLRANMALTVRSLGVGLPPDEETVFVQYRAPGRTGGAHVIAVPWYVGTGMIGDLIRTDGAGICEPIADGAKARAVLWKRETWIRQRRPVPEESPETTQLPHVFEFRRVARPDAGKNFGYIRIRTFDHDAGAIVQEFERILLAMREQAPDGLILDVRSNPGGSVQAAESLLQMMSPAEIVPASFHFANTPLMQDVLADLQTARKRTSVERLELVEGTAVLFEDWFDESVDAVASGSPLTGGHPVTAPHHANARGQIYQAPVALLIDAASYSATDIFAAGFQDHGIGVVIGTDDNTGGGGAVRWLHRNQLVEGLKRTLPHLPLKRLPDETDMGLALQRSARVGPNAGRPVEDVGVACDLRHVLTKNDLLNGSEDLIRLACDRLAAQNVYSLRIVNAVRNGAVLDVTVAMSGIERLVCYVDGHPQLAADDSRLSFPVPLDGSPEQFPKELKILGYARRIPGNGTLELAASAKAAIAQPALQVQAAG